jgi:putative membrane protein (TIGR04086 family)
MTHSLKPGPIVLGFVIDTVATMLFGLAYVAVSIARDGIPDDPATEVVMTTGDYAVFAVVGLSFVAAGGFVAAKKADIRPVAHGVCVGLACLALTLVLELLAHDASEPLWFTATSVIGVVPAGAVGGLLARKVS